MTFSSKPPEVDMPTDRTSTFQAAVRVRRSYRAFLDKPVPDDVIKSVLDDAQYTPSNCNTQPWHVHVVSGAKRDELSKILHAKNEAGEITSDFSFDTEAFYPPYKQRQEEQGGAYYQSLGIEREDKAARHRAAARGNSFYGAPHAALLFMPSFGDNVRVAGDIGMYGQTFLLSLAARGLGGIPQTSLGYHAGTIREFLDIPETFKMLFGISFGYPDEASPENAVRLGRVPLTESVVFHS